MSLGMEMMFKSLGIDPVEIMKQGEAMKQVAENVKKRLDSMDTRLTTISAQLQSILDAMEEPSPEDEPLPEPVYGRALSEGESVAEEPALKPTLVSG